MNTLKKIIPQTILKLIYNSLILPHLQYSILCWGFNSSKVFKLQKRAIRLISGSKYNAHTEPLFKELNLLKLDDIFKICTLKFYYKMENKTLPAYFSDLSQGTLLTHAYQTRNRDTLQVPQSKTTSGSKCLRYYLPTLTRDTSDCIKRKALTHSPKGFAMYAKNHYLCKYEQTCYIPDCYICGP